MLAGHGDAVTEHSARVGGLEGHLQWAKEAEIGHAGLLKKGRREGERRATVGLKDGVSKPLTRGGHVC